MGPRRVLMRIVIWWSFFTAATGWVKGLSSLVTVRALFGAGEAGCYPNLTKAFTTWLPQDERVRAQGITWMSSRWGGAFTPLLVVYMYNFMTWRQTFEFFGALGVVWALVFFWWYRDNPKDHKSVNSAELALLERGRSIPLRDMGTCPGGSCVSLRTFGCSGFNTPRSPIPGISTSPGCQPTSKSPTTSSRKKQPSWLGSPCSLEALARSLVAGSLPLSPGKLGASPKHAASSGFSVFARRSVLLFISGSHQGPRDCFSFHGIRQLLQRPRHARQLGSVHGYRRQVRRHAFRLDEYDG